MKIAAVDNAAMNSLMKIELSRTKTAAEEQDAFKDHKEYESVLEKVLSEDTRESWSPNDMKLD